jgi:hypothetical protein
VLLPTLVHTLPLLDKVTDCPDRCHPVQSLWIRWCLPNSTRSLGGRTLREFWLSVEGLSPRWINFVWKGGGPPPLWWWLSMFWWKVAYVKTPGLEFTVREPSAQGAWVCGYVPLFPALGSAAPQKPGGCRACLAPKCPQVVGWGMHGKAWYGLLLRIVPFFGWVAPALLPGVARPYPVWAAWPLAICCWWELIISIYFGL